MDPQDIKLLEQSLLRVILDEIGASAFKKHADFARAAFGDEVANYNGKWFRLRNGKNGLTFADLVKIGDILHIEPALLVAQASMLMRKERLLSNSEKAERAHRRK